VVISNGSGPGRGGEHQVGSVSFEQKKDGSSDRAASVAIASCMPSQYDI